MPYDTKDPLHRAIDKRLSVYERWGLTPQQVRAIASGVLWAMHGEFRDDGCDAMAECILTVLNQIEE